MSVERLPSLLLRLTGLAAFVCSILLYLEADFSVLALLLLLLVPDLSLLAFAAGPRTGAVVYNLAHAPPLAIALATVGVLADWSVGLQLGLIWIAHIGMDWAVGYGLKYPSDPKDTHLQRV